MRTLGSSGRLTRTLLCGVLTASLCVPAPVIASATNANPLYAFPRTERISGADRVATSIEISRAAFPGGAQTVVIATAHNFPDALAGAPLAAALGGPLLLTPANYLPQSLSDHIRDSGTRSAVILGGDNAVGPAVEESLASLLGPTNVHRIEGQSRFATAQRLAHELQSVVGPPSKVIIAVGDNFPDALAASPLAAWSGWPILLVRANALPPETASAIVASGAREALILGGAAAVGEEVKKAVESLGLTTQRLEGSGRYATSVSIAEYACAQGMSWSRTMLATGSNYPDALAGGVLGAVRGGPLLLSRPGDLADSGPCISSHAAAIDSITLIGGPTALRESVRDAAEATLARTPVPPTAISMGTAEKYAVIRDAVQYVDVSAVLSPAGSYSQVTYSVDDPAVLAVSADSGWALPLAPGVATVTARSANGLECSTTVYVSEQIDPTHLDLSGILSAFRPDLQISADVTDLIDGAPLALLKTKELNSQARDDQWKTVYSEPRTIPGSTTPAVSFWYFDVVNPFIIRRWCVDAPSGSSSAEHRLVYARNTDQARQSDFQVIKTYDGHYQFVPVDNPDVCIGVTELAEGASVELVPLTATDPNTKWALRPLTVGEGTGGGGQTTAWIKDTGGSKVTVWGGTDFDTPVWTFDSKQQIGIYDWCNAGSGWVLVVTPGGPGFGGYVQANLITRTNPNIVPAPAPAPPTLDGVVNTWPVPGYKTISSQFGWRKCPYHGREHHSGIDIAGSGINGKPIVAAGNGVVLKAYKSSSYGYVMEIDHGKGMKTLYAHQLAGGFKAVVGQRVTAGQVIGTVGSTGNSTGPHLHFEVTKNGVKQNPLSFVK